MQPPPTFFFVLNLDFSKLGWNSKSLLIYTDLTKHAQLKITHKKNNIQSFKEYKRSSLSFDAKFDMV